MSTFLRLELAGRDGDVTLINVDHIVRIAPTWPKGATLVLSDDTSLHVRASLDDLHAGLSETDGNTQVHPIEEGYKQHRSEEAAEDARVKYLS